MEKVEKIAELKAMLENLKEIAELYNGMVEPQERVAVVPQQLKDVSNVIVCVYNKNRIGLFKKINWSSVSGGYSRRYYSAGIIYDGIDSYYTALRTTHKNYDNCDCWGEIGARVDLGDRTYIANCVINDCMSFDDMRLIMYSADTIGPYKIGKATSEEMLEVLKYAYSYYELESKKLKR